MNQVTDAGTQAACSNNQHIAVKKRISEFRELAEGHWAFSSAWGLMLFVSTPILLPILLFAAFLAGPEFLAGTAATPLIVWAFWFVTLCFLLATQEGKGYPHKPSEIEKFFTGVVVFFVLTLARIPGYVIHVGFVAIAALAIPIAFLIDLRRSCK